MPLPAESERAGRTIAAELARFDQALLDHIETGDTLPTVATVMAPIIEAARRSAIAAIRETTPSITTRQVDAAVKDIVDPIRTEIVAQLRAARAVRRRIPRRAPSDDDDDGSPIAALVKRVGAGAALILVLRRRRPRAGRPDQVRQVMRQVGLPAPRPTAAYGRMVLRTETARARNMVAADIVERAPRLVNPETGREIRGPAGNGLVLLIRDARKGPTDEPCEKVNGRYATARWIRRHPLEHPNCTRQAIPTRLPPGARVTLLA